MEDEASNMTKTSPTITNSVRQKTAEKIQRYPATTTQSFGTGDSVHR